MTYDMQFMVGSGVLHVVTYSSCRQGLAEEWRQRRLWRSHVWGNIQSCVSVHARLPSLWLRLYRTSGARASRCTVSILWPDVSFSSTDGCRSL